jgi:hypothetical protein
MSDYGKDRRAHRRYSITLRLEYKLMEYGCVCHTGFGETVNLSSHGLLCQVNEKLPDNRHIEVAVQWPYLLYGTCPLKLVMEGRIVRASRLLIGIEAKSIEFRTVRTAARAGVQ